LTEDESLLRYGLRPGGQNLDEIRNLLRERMALERASQGDGDVELMKLCCVQLFNAGLPGDILLIWQAKEASWDAHHGIDMQLLCGPGLGLAKEYLAADGSGEARKALEYLLSCEAAGDLDGFTVEDRSRWYAAYYQG
jgi:hypothetical protein